MSLLASGQHVAGSTQASSTLESDRPHECNGELRAECDRLRAECARLGEERLAEGARARREAAALATLLRERAQCAITHELPHEAAYCVVLTRYTISDG